MKKPSPLILLMGGGALINVALMVNGLHVAAWLRYAGMALLIGLGITSLVLALRMAFEKKPARPRYQSKRSAPVGLRKESAAARQAPTDAPGPTDPPKGPHKDPR